VALATKADVQANYGIDWKGLNYPGRNFTKLSKAIIFKR